MNEIAVLAATVALNVTPASFAHASEHATASNSGYDRFFCGDQTGDTSSWTIRTQPHPNSGLLLLLASWDLEDASLSDDNFDADYAEFIAHTPRLS